MNEVNILKEWMIKEGYNNNQLAKMLGVSRQSVGEQLEKHARLSESFKEKMITAGIHIFEVGKKPLTILKVDDYEYRAYINDLIQAKDQLLAAKDEIIKEKDKHITELKARLLEKGSINDLIEVKMDEGVSRLTKVFQQSMKKVN